MIDKMSKILKATMFCVLGITMAATLVIVLPASTASAEGLADDPQPPTSNERDGTLFIERVYQRTVHIYDHVGKDYSRVPNITERVNRLVERLGEHGKDSSTIEEALSQFGTAVALGQPEIDEAGGILGAHNGFDENGKLTDKETARQTLKDSREALKNAHQTFHESSRSLIVVIRDYRANLQPVVTPAPSGT